MKEINTNALAVSFTVICNYKMNFKQFTDNQSDSLRDFTSIGGAGAVDIKTIATTLPWSNVSLVKVKIMCA